MIRNWLNTKRFGGGTLALGMSLLSLTSVTGVAAGLMVPVSVHAQSFGDDDDDVKDKDNPNQVPTNATVWDAKKLQQLDRDVRKLERSVARVENKNNPPILIEPDPEVVALQAIVDNLSRKQDDQTATITRLTGALEESQHQNQVLNSQVVALNSRIDSLTKRADMTEAHLKDVDVALAPPPPPPASTGDPEADFEQAFNLMTSGQIDDADRAFTAFTTTWPEAPQLAEAWFRLGQIRTMKQDPSGAVAAFATALKGWPKTSWAPEATVKLADALTTSNRPTEACQALTQFDKLYSKSATSDSKTLAKSLKTKDNCTS